jgi:photosystem II stability/assembly factor-like uncharacterized protein
VHHLVDTALVVHTTNAGGNWQEQRFDSIGQLLRVVFIDSLHGWINTGPNFILRTTTGGQSWQRLVTPVNNFTGLSFIDTLRGWGCWVNQIYRTTDGGLSWEPQYTITPPPPEDFYVGNISFVDSLNGWAFGGGFYNGGDVGMIYRTTNGGSSWYRESLGLVAVGFGDGLVVDRYHGWAVAADGRVVHYRLITSVPERLARIPSGFFLRQNYPNPFNATTTIEYELPRSSSVTLAIHDLTGRRVETLVHQTQDAGVYRASFNAASLASGTYFYTLEALPYRDTKQLILIK